MGNFFAGGPRDGQWVQVTIDGKTLRGSIPAGQTRGVHLMAAYVPGEGVVMAQVEVGGKENEIKAAPRLLEAIDLRGKVVSADAMLAQRQLSVQIVEAGESASGRSRTTSPHCWMTLPPCLKAHLRIPASARQQDLRSGKPRPSARAMNGWNIAPSEPAPVSRTTWTGPMPNRCSSWNGGPSVSRTAR